MSAPTDLRERVAAWCDARHDLIAAADDPISLAEGMARDLDAAHVDVLDAFAAWLRQSAAAMAREQRAGYVDKLRREARARKTRKI